MRQVIKIVIPPLYIPPDPFQMERKLIVLSPVEIIIVVSWERLSGEHGGTSEIIKVLDFGSSQLVDPWPFLINGLFTYHINIMGNKNLRLFNQESGIN